MSHQQKSVSTQKAAATSSPASQLVIGEVSTPLSEFTIQRSRLNPQALTPREVLTLQKTVGNSNVQRLLSNAAPHTPQKSWLRPVKIRVAQPVVQPLRAKNAHGLPNKNGLIQRAGLMEDQRRSWKEMSPGEKMMALMVSPLNALPGMAVGGYKGATSAYKAALGNKKDPGTLRKLLAGGAGILGGIGGGIAGGLGGALWGIANPLWSGAKAIGRGGKWAGGKAVEGGKWVANKARGLPQQIDEARGIFPDVKSPGHDTGTDITDYTLTGMGAGASAAGTLVDISTRIEQNELLTSVKDLGDSGAADTFFGLGLGAGVLGMGTSLIETGRGVGEMLDSSRSTGDRVSGFGRTAGGASNFARHGGTAAYNLGSLMGNSAVSSVGQSITGVAGIATGTMDMLRGGYGAYKAHQREKALTEIANNDADHSADGETIRDAAKQAAGTQSTRKTTALMTIGKGALAVVGGGLLLASATTPVGWALLGGAALVGGVIALVRFLKNRKRKREVALRVLGVEQEQKEWERKVEEIESDTRIFTDKRKQRMKALGPSPLDEKLKEGGFKSVGHVYAKHITDTAEFLHLNGVEQPRDDVVKLLQTMGLKVDPQKGTPDTTKIAKALHG